MWGECSGDRHRLRGGSTAELDVQIAGLLARLLMETQAALCIRGLDDLDRIDVLIDSGANLRVLRHGQPILRWTAPVVVAEVSAEVVEQLSEWAASPGQLQLLVTNLTDEQPPQSVREI